jgi:hypothetical protein
MKPESDRVPDFNLPEPRSDAGGLPPVAVSPLPTSGVEATGQANPPAPSAIGRAGLSMQNAGTSSISDDEFTKQTIAAAQKIVATTGQDPYRQAQELQNLKNSYINKRFGQTIKLTEDS